MPQQSKVGFLPVLICKAVINALVVLSRGTGGVEEMDKLFTFLGRFIGKAVLDGRQLDMPISETFFKWLRGDPLGLADLRSVNPTVHQSLSSLNELCKAKQLIARDKQEVHFLFLLAYES